MQILSIFFALFLLFNSSWVYEVLKDQPGPLLNSTIDFPIVNEQEVTGAKWLADIKGDKLVYSDEIRWWLLIRFNPQQKIIYLPEDANKIQDHSYVYFGNFNIINKNVLLLYREKAIARTEYVDSSYIITNRSRIYDIGSAEVHYR